MVHHMFFSPVKLFSINYQILAYLGVRLLQGWDCSLWFTDSLKSRDFMANNHKSQAGPGLLSTALESFLHRHNTTIIDCESLPQFIKEELCGAVLSKSIIISSVLLLNTIKLFRKIFELNILGGVNLCVPDICATSVQFVAQSCVTLCDPMNHSTPDLSIHHQLPESTQTHVHWVSDAIQPSHPLSSPSPPAFNLSQHQGLF